jgi:gluconate 2-dehydrogenase gamma chain
MKNQVHTRRHFLKTSGTMFGGSWLSMNMPLFLAAAQTACSRRESGESWVVLDAAEATGFGAIADQVIPPDETPGAVETGVVHFIDAAMSGFMADVLPMLRDGLASLDRQAGEYAFADLEFDRQTELLEVIEETPFFGTMQMLTLMGMFAMPKYGGNRDEAGWKLLGFDHRHMWQPPFGYYDGKRPAGEEDDGR